MGCKKNQTIRCTVDQCKHHEKTENFCALDSITVGTHEANPTMDQCTDCLSFEKQPKYKGALYGARDLVQRNLPFRAGSSHTFTLANSALGRSPDSARLKLFLYIHLQHRLTAKL